MSRGTGCLVWGAGFFGMLMLASWTLPSLVSAASFDGAMTTTLWTAALIALVGWLYTTQPQREDPLRRKYSFALSSVPTITLDQRTRRAEIVAGAGRHHAVPVDLITDITVERRTFGGVAYVWTSGKRDIELDGVTRYEEVEACSQALREMKASTTATTPPPAGGAARQAAMGRDKDERPSAQSPLRLSSDLRQCASCGAPLLAAASSCPLCKAPAATTSSSTIQAPEDRLARAKKMRDDGLITDAEYEAVKTKVLGEL